MFLFVCENVVVCGHWFFNSWITPSISNGKQITNQIASWRKKLYLGRAEGKSTGKYKTNFDHRKFGSENSSKIVNYF